ncbi:hypothetical protein FA136_14115 [Pseudomonas aeruginosa]|nr:hypothetical protein [Pseudomonas aeruginosa]
MLRLKASPALFFGLLLASAASFAAQPPAGMLQPLRGTIQQAADDHLQHGTLKALEVHVFAPSLRGSGEGHRPWENADGSASTMTNGTVGNLVVSQGRRMTVKYGDGEKTVVVPDDVPIVSLEPGERSLLKPGAKVVLFPQKGADGSLTALAISVGKDGVTPPM